MRARLSHGVIDIGGGQNAYGHGQYGGRYATMVARPIQSFMMLCRKRTHRSKGFDVGKHAFGIIGVQTYPLPLGVRKWAWLVPDRVGDADATEIVEEACP